MSYADDEGYDEWVEDATRADPQLALAAALAKLAAALNQNKQGNQK